MKSTIITIGLIFVSFFSDAQKLNKKDMIFSDSSDAANGFINNYYPNRTVEMVFTAQKDLPQGVDIYVSVFSKVYTMYTVHPMKKGETMIKVLHIE